jgi:deoxyribodipyrimidine photolyase-related protein
MSKGHRALRLVLGDQLTRGLASLRDCDRVNDIILLCEVSDETSYVRHHQQKLVMILSAMRHFADDLRADGFHVAYVALDDPDNSGSFTGEVKRAIDTFSPDQLVVTEPGEYRVRQMMEEWQRAFTIPVEIRDDHRFLASRRDFATWADGRKELRMEFFYREMRKKTGLLMEQGKPIGGQWNFDIENRKALPKGHRPPERLRFSPDAVTQEVMALVTRRFSHHPGSIESFGWPVTRRDALIALDHFIADALPSFGEAQDAMLKDEVFLYHALLSPALNCGLLLPHEVCVAAERAYHEGHTPLNAFEGFIRQIIGWREYVRGLYWLLMPDYSRSNSLDAHRPLPEFYWSGDTQMACLAASVKHTMEHAYAHHIERLMVLGNFALLAGIAPHDLEAWFLAVYADAYEWVELPNVHGMALYADGGVMASKPYAASGAYIDRMSDFCSSCAFDVKLKLGPKACPFNYLYWDFLDRNGPVLRGNPRLGMPYRTLDKMPLERREEISQDAARFLSSLADGSVTDGPLSFQKEMW